MKPIHLLAAALLATGGLALATPAVAAPKGGPGVSYPAGDVILVGDRDRDDDRDWWRYRDRDGDGDRDWWRHRDRDGDGDRDWRRHRHGDRWDRRHHRHFGWYRGWDRGRHLGWRRGRGHDDDWRPGRGRGHDRHWHDDDWDDSHKAWKKREKLQEKWTEEHRRWHARQHPQRSAWVGRPFRREDFSVLRDYGDYRLPPPWGGQFYARSGDDVFLVDEASRVILDAFLLSNAFRR